MTEQKTPYFPSGKRGWDATATVEEMAEWVLGALNNDNVVRFVTDHDLDLRAIDSITDLEVDLDNWTPGHVEMPRSTIITLANGQKFRVTIQED